MPNHWLSLTALGAALMGIGLGLAALILALDDDGPTRGWAGAGPLSAAAERGIFGPGGGLFPGGPDGADSGALLPRIGERIREQIGEAIEGGGPWLGISVEESADGLTIASVAADSPATTAGLQAGDRITAVGDQAVESRAALAEAIRAHAPGDAISVAIERDGKAQSVTATLGERPGLAIIRGMLPPGQESLPPPGAGTGGTRTG